MKLGETFCCAECDHEYPQPRRHWNCACQHLRASVALAHSWEVISVKLRPMENCMITEIIHWQWEHSGSSYKHFDRLNPWSPRARYRQGRAITALMLAAFTMLILTRLLSVLRKGGFTIALSRVRHISLGLHLVSTRRLRRRKSWM